MGASALNYKRETPADPLPLVGRGAGWGGARDGALAAIQTRQTQPLIGSTFSAARTK